MVNFEHKCLAAHIQKDDIFLQPEVEERSEQTASMIMN